MMMERAVYSRKALQTCVKLVKTTNWTVRLKREHFSKCFEVEKVFIQCLELTNCILFEPDHSNWKDYIRKVDSKGISKKELDLCLRRCYLFLCSEINAITTLMETGEVDVAD